MQLMGKVAVVTGSANGIGRAIALSFAREGADVVVADIDLAGAEAVVKEVEAFKRRTMAVKVDVSNLSDVKMMVETSINVFGNIDILVNNAGVIEGQPFLEISEESWDRVFAVNLKSCFLCSQTVAKEMVKRKAGKIINLSSSGSERVYPRWAQYAASKGGVNSLTRAMAFELAPYNIHVNAIAPGPTLTPKAKRRSEEFIESRRRAIPLGRHGKPENIAEAAVFLASESSDFVTGHILYVDGGISAVHAVHILTGI
jgi:glucose 1-dehydrogenase